MLMASEQHVSIELPQAQVISMDCQPHNSGWLESNRIFKRHVRQFVKMRMCACLGWKHIFGNESLPTVSSLWGLALFHLSCFLSSFLIGMSKRVSYKLYKKLPTPIHAHALHWQANAASASRCTATCEFMRRLILVLLAFYEAPSCCRARRMWCRSAEGISYVWVDAYTSHEE